VAPGIKRKGSLLCALACALCLGLLPAAAAQAATGPGSAVVLVSGFDTVTPFSTSAAGCAGQEGPAWSPAGGVAAALKAAGYTVFTAPVMQGGGQPAAPCAPGTAVPPLSEYINSNGDVNANGQALGRFLAFLNANYGVTRVDLVAHSDGGLWSRSAITQSSNYPNLAVTSLTTLGTPHTGSFIADLSQYISNGQCKAPNHVAQLVCLALQSTVQFVVNDLGELTVTELTNEYLRTWNPEQRIGSCPVTGIAGTYFDFPLPPSIFPAYYNPSDGLVGEASATAQASKSIFGTPIPAPGIPNFTNGGEFPVVHGTSFAFLTKKNLLNQPAISARVVAALNSQPAAGPPCSTGPSTPAPAAALSVTDNQAVTVIPLLHHVVPRRGTLPRPGGGDVVLHTRKIRLYCGKRRLRSIPFLGSRKLRITLASCKRRLRVKGKGRAVMFRNRGQAVLNVQGQSVIVQPGVKARKLGLSFEGASRFVQVPLNGSGQGTLPAGSGPITLRVSVTPDRGPSLTGSATVSR
jgi:triacylglycerol lipase